MTARFIILGGCCGRVEPLLQPNAATGRGWELQYLEPQIGETWKAQSFWSNPDPKGWGLGDTTRMGWFFLSVWYRNVPKTWQLQCFPVLLEIIPSFMWDSPTAIDIHKPYHDWGWLISTIYRTHKHMMIVVMTWGLSNWLQTWVYHGLPHAFPCYTAHKHMVMTWGWLISAPPTIRPRWVCQRVAGECRSDPNPCVQWPKHHLWMSGWEHMGKHGNLWDFTMNYRVFSYV